MEALKRQIDPIQDIFGAMEQLRPERGEATRVRKRVNQEISQLKREAQTLFKSPDELEEDAVRLQTQKARRVERQQAKNTEAETQRGLVDRLQAEVEEGKEAIRVAKLESKDLELRYKVLEKEKRELAKQLEDAKRSKKPITWYGQEKEPREIRLTRGRMRGMTNLSERSLEALAKDVEDSEVDLEAARCHAEKVRKQYALTKEAWKIKNQ